MNPDWPSWAGELAVLYESHAANQFILCGNIADDFLESSSGGATLVKLEDFVLRSLLPNFDVVIQYDLGNGLRVPKGGTIFSEWRNAPEDPATVRAPRAAMETLTHYLRYVANLTRLGRKSPQVAVLLQSADLIAPALPNSLSYDLNALALLIRDWSREEALRQHPLTTFLLCENWNDLHPLLATNADAAVVTIPLPSPETLGRALEVLNAGAGAALREFSADLPGLGRQLAGATLKSVRRLLLLKSRENKPIRPEDVALLKKGLVEKECDGLIEFIEPTRNLDSLDGQPALKTWLREDIALWNKNDLRAMPMGYLLCGPVGTGKTYSVECLAGEAGVPVVKIKNFRDRWVGSTEGNLEKIFRLLRALGRCFVFIDEADQALGKRDSGSNDAGLSGRIYSMFAKEMSDRSNRGKIVWILASSRPDLIEVDLKRPGRVDVKIPILPTATARESFSLIRALAGRLDLDVPESAFPVLEPQLPVWLTPGAAEALATKVYRRVQTGSGDVVPVLSEALSDYQPPVAREVMEFQIRLAVAESTDVSFIPEAFREFLSR